MARPPRIEFPGAVYHVSSRRGDGVPAFADDEDRRELLDLLAQAAQRFDAQVLAYCLLPAHYDLVLYTRQANLSRLMRHVNGVYTQYHHRRHGGTGTLFQGRFKALLVDRDALLLDVCRFVELGPQRERLVGALDDWPWSSYAAHAGQAPAPDWLDVDGLHSFVLGRPVRTAAEHRKAGERYARLVASEPGLRLWPDRLREQIFLGDADFAERMRAQLSRRGGAARPRAWNEWLRDSGGQRDAALYRAHTEGGWSMTGLAQVLGLSVSRISRLIASYEQGQGAS